MYLDMSEESGQEVKDQGGEGHSKGPFPNGALFLAVALAVFLLLVELFGGKRAQDPRDGLCEHCIHIQVRGLSDKDGVYLAPRGANPREFLERLGVKIGGDVEGFVLEDFTSLEFSEGGSPFRFSTGTMREREIYLLGYTMDLNRATTRDLVLLPEVGPALARKIVRERARGGPFESLEDLQRVRGIRKSSLASLEGLVTVGERKPLGGIGEDGR